MTRPGEPFWVASPVLQRHLNRTATGDPACDWLTLVRREHLPLRLERTLVLGCGSGFLERALLLHEGVGAILATDPDPAAVEAATRRARREGRANLAYAVLDPARDPIPAGPWDAILANDLLHRSANVDAALARIHDALARNGRFVFSEYTGPPQFRPPDEAREIIDRYFRLLPDRWRTPSGAGAPSWRRLSRPEGALSAVAGGRLLSAARRAFHADAELSAGGGLLHPLLDGLAGNHRVGSTEDERLLEVLCAAETHLTSLGVLAPTHTVFVGRRRDG